MARLGGLITRTYFGFRLVAPYPAYRHFLILSFRLARYQLREDGSRLCDTGCRYRGRARTYHFHSWT